MKHLIKTGQNDIFALIEAIDTPAALCDVSGDFLICNARFREDFCEQNVSMIGENLKDFWDESDQLTLSNLFVCLVDETGKSRQAFCSRLTVHAFDTLAGTRLLVQAVQQDKDDPLLRYFLAQADQAYWEFNVRDDRFTVSDSWREMRGYGPDEDVNNLSRDWLEDVHPEDVEHLKASIAAQVSGQKKSVRIQYRRRHMMTDKWLWIMCRATVVEFDENNVPVRIVGTDTDISEIKQGETEFAQLNEKIQLAIEVAGIGIWEFDSTNSQVHWDDRLLAIYGLEPGSSYQNEDFWAQRIHPDDREATVEFAAECARTKSDLVCDFRIVRPDGEVRHVRTMARYVDPSAMQTKLFGVNIDVTKDVLQAQEVERARKQLEFDARHDALTGLANRRFLDETLMNLSGAMRDDQETCVMHLDLDHFKAINDSSGHAAGDDVLVHVAHVLRQFIGEQGTVFRMGGDEFAVLYERPVSQKSLSTTAQQIIQALKVPLDYNGHACSFGVSIGAAQGKGRDALKTHIFAQADIALYAAKGAGRSCFRMYSTRCHASAATDLKRRQDLLDAISEGTIKMWYQPQYDPSTLRMVGAEALVRIEHPVSGLLYPQDFLALAKETGLLALIEHIILKCVLADQTKWAAAGLCYPRIAINISADRLASPSMIDQLRSEMDTHHAISFELLETAFLDAPEKTVMSNLNQLRALDIPIELDDFGSGHASILALKTIRPDTVKIDRNLVKDMPWDSEALAIICTIIAIARALKIRVILEGIEEQEHLKTALTLDCDALQGFGLCRPQSFDDFSQTLAAGSGQITTRHSLTRDNG